ncbi:hypothetical protein [Bacillus swezeyi]|nr:hypothetical protein [Bacillus swezeyi]
MAFGMPLIYRRARQFGRGGKLDAEILDIGLGAIITPTAVNIWITFL